MPRLNQVSLIGHLGAEPEFVNFANGGGCATLSVATDESYRKKDSDQRVDATEWHRIQIYGDRLVETVQKLSSDNKLKGAQVYIQGKLRTRSWEDQDGKKRFVTEVIVTSFEGFQLLGKKSDSAGAPPDRNGGTPPPPESGEPSA